MNPTAEPALGIVRRYTDKRQEEGRSDTLTQALVTKVDSDRQDEFYGRKLFKDSALDVLRASEGQGPDDDFLRQISELNGVSDELQNDWNEVITILNKKEKQNLPSKPDITTLSRLFQDAQEKLQAKRISRSGKTKTWLIDVAESIDKHRFLLNMLPEGDKYTSVMVGSFTALIQVAVTYRKTTKMIADSFDQISEKVHHLRRALIQNQENIHIREQVGKFYCHFFRFLIHILKEWLLSSRRRFFSSFGDNLVEELNDAVQRMARCSKNVEKEIQLEHQRSSTEVRAALERVANLKHLGGSGLATLFNITVNCHFDPYNSSLAQALANPLLAQPSSSSTDFEASASSVAETEDLAAFDHLNSPFPQAGLQNAARDEEKADGKAQVDDKDDNLDHYSTKAMIQGAVAHFKPFFQDAYIKDLASQAEYLPVSAEMRGDILDMASSHQSAALWVQGQEEYEAPSKSTLTAAHMFHGLRQLGIATVGYFISRTQPGTMDGERELFSMVCALVYQISLVLSDNIRFAISLDEKMAPLRVLPESDSDVSRSLTPAIALLEALLKISPPLLFCVVDGFHLLGNHASSPAARSASKRFIACICEAATRKQEARTQIFKALFTTEEFCEQLQDAANKGAMSCVVHEDEDNDDTMDFDSDDVVDLAHD